MITGNIKQKIQEQESLEVAPFPKLVLTDFNEEQVKYLEMLTKFSGRKSKLEVINQQTIPLQKEVFIKENFTLLGINEQVSYNDLKGFMEKHKIYAFYCGGFASLLAMGYYTMVTPTTRSLGLEALKSLGIGIFSGYSYFKIRDIQYKDSLHSYYITVLNRAHEGRRQYIAHHK